MLESHFVHHAVHYLYVFFLGDRFVYRLAEFVVIFDGLGSLFCFYYTAVYLVYGAFYLVEQFVAETEYSFFPLGFAVLRAFALCVPIFFPCTVSQPAVFYTVLFCNVAQPQIGCDVLLFCRRNAVHIIRSVPKNCCPLSARADSRRQSNPASRNF